MMTERDYRVIQKVGDHRILSRKQITYLFFPGEDGNGSEYTAWRRISKELKPNGYLSDEFYITLNAKGKCKKLYRLDKAGKALYKDMTGRKYDTPRWNLTYLPHLLTTNWLLIKLEIDDFELEYDFGGLKTDAYFNEMAVEVDNGTQVKSIIKEKAKRYLKFRINVIWYSNRAFKLRKWVNEVSKDLAESSYFCRQKDQSIKNLKMKLGIK